MVGKGEKQDFVKWFFELSNKDVAVAGGKGASLAEMYNLKIPVPPGFVVTAQAYAYFIKKTGLDVKIKETLSGLDVNDTVALNATSKKLREMIEAESLPKEMEDEIVEAYEILDAKKDEESDDALRVLEKSGEDIFVAVRSSATTEDLVDASFAGQQDTFLNVLGKENLLEKVKKCMSSLFTARAIYYREKKGFAHEKSYLSVVVQKMIDYEKSGVIFSQNPTRDDKSIVIEAVFGLGEGIVSGKIKPDHFIVSSDLENFKIVVDKVSVKKIAIIRNEQGENQTVKLKEERSKTRVLSDYEIKRLAQYARELEEHYKKPQDIEFAIDREGIYIVQSRPITTSFKKAEGEVSGNVLLSGLGASPGIASGVVKVVHELSELEKIEKGDVLVTKMTNPDMVVTMEKSAAIITDEGGITSHAAIISREMGIPAVVGTEDATEKLKDGDEVTVDGNSGKVFEGKGETKLAEVLPIVPTKTEIKVIVDLPGFAERAAKSKAKSVGLLRLEGIIASSGKHPKKFVDENKIEDYVKLIADGVKKISEPFEEVWIRTSDIRSDEFRNLEGAAKEVEPNPMLGDHGIRFSLKHKDIMKAELLAIKEVADDFPEKKFGVMMPQVISAGEIKETKKLAEEIGVPKNIKIGIMVETPAAVQTINELCEEGIEFISFGTNDLTQYTLAIDRNNEDVQDIYDEMHPAVLSSLRYVIRRCKKHGVKTSICGQAGSREEMVKFLIAEGIDSISVNADAAQKVSELVAKLEENVEVVEPAGAGDFGGVEGGGGVDVDRTENGGGMKQESEQNIKSLDNIDIEDEILKELENNGGDYVPGDLANGKKDIPALNESIPVDSEIFQKTSEEEGEKILEDEALRESEEEFLKEWAGEKRERKSTQPQ
ncbi:MAG: phosphoenolpyruvate synthase [Nanoarchaeota archaeon]|nr:phosphoenolpyruvate synthase [Nanoarchaeota archaeon]